jgi:hypothetical protein
VFLRKINKNLNNKIMPKLSKPKSFSVSNETIQVDFQGTTCEVANLLKSGITNQTIILVAHADKWHEVEVSDLRINENTFLENSHLPSFAHYVGVHNISLVDLGIISEDVKTDYNLTHQDFMDLEKQFPSHSYIKISKLNDYNVLQGEKASVYNLTQWLNVCQRDNISIDELIQNREIQKQNLLKSMKTEKIVSENESVTELEITEGNQLGIPVEKTEPVEKIDLAPVNAEVIKTANTTTISETFSEKPAKKPISIQVFETLTPERISELQGLKEKQLEIVKKNPVVKKITDKTSYELAKKTKSALLKASTAIDGKDGIEATATKYLNTFKNMLKNALLPIAKLTRDAYDEQSQIISAWENAEALRQQAEQRAKLEKIQKRTDELFAVPFTFNGTIYSIGTVYCTPSQVETAADEDFKAIIESGKSIKQALDAEATLQAGKDKEIADLKAQLAAFMALQNMSNTEPKSETEVKNEHTVLPVSNKPANNVVISPTNNTVQNPVSTTHAAPPAPQPQTAAPVYNLPNPKNEPLNRLDLENAEHLENKNYLKCRSYFIRGMKELSAEIEFILNDTAPNPVKKSERIQNLLEIIKKSE